MDLATSLGVPNERVVAAVPTFAVRFSLRDVQQNLPGSPTSEYPIQISKGQVMFLPRSSLSSLRIIFESDKIIVQYDIVSTLPRVKRNEKKMFYYFTYTFRCVQS